MNGTGGGGLELEKGQLGRQIHGSAGEGIRWEGTASSGKMSSDRHICAVAHDTPLYNSACMYVCVCVVCVVYCDEEEFCGDRHALCVDSAERRTNPLEALKLHRH